MSQADEVFCAVGVTVLFILVVGLYIAWERAKGDAADWKREAIRLWEDQRGGKPPCIHGNLCRAYMREAHCILRQTCPSGCEFYQPKNADGEMAIMCKNCDGYSRYRDKDGGWCVETGFDMPEDGFCSFGHQKEVEDETD